MTHAIAHHSSSSDKPGTSAPILVLRDELLFAAGNPRLHLYLIERGTVGVYRERSGLHPELIEFAFAGDVVGMGALTSQAHSAQAVGEVRVRCLPLDALDSVLRNDPRAMRRYAEAVQHEFEARRDRSLGTTPKPLGQVAAFLVAVSNLNESDGRDPLIVSDSLECGTAATFLGIDFETFARSLAELGRSGMIESSASAGLHLLDLNGLKRMADPSAFAVLDAACSLPAGR